MSTPYIEQDCTIQHEGHSFTSGGAFKSDGYMIAYCDTDMKTVCNWHDNQTMGIITRTLSWPIHNSPWSDKMFQITVRDFDGQLWTGRTLGGGMIARLRPKRSK